MCNMSLGCSSINAGHFCSLISFIHICIRQSKSFSIMGMWTAWWIIRIMTSPVTGQSPYVRAAETRSRSLTLSCMHGSNPVTLTFLSSRLTILEHSSQRHMYRHNCLSWWDALFGPVAQQMSSQPLFSWWQPLISRVNILAWASSSEPCGCGQSYQHLGHSHPSVDLGFGFQHSILFSRETICLSSWGIDLVSCLLSCKLFCWARWRDLSLDFGPSSGRHIHGENNVCPSASPPASSTASLPPHLPPCPLYLLCLPFLHLHHHLLHQHHRLLQNLTH